MFSYLHTWASNCVYFTFYGSGCNYRMYELAGGIYDWDAFGNLMHQWLRFRLFTKWMCSKNYFLPEGSVN